MDGLIKTGRHVNTWNAGQGTCPIEIVEYELTTQMVTPSSNFLTQRISNDKTLIVIYIAAYISIQARVHE